MEENNEMKEAKEKLKVMSEDERMQILAELREKAIRDEKAIKRFAIREGLEEGKKQGIEQGMKQGMKNGINKGKKQEKKDIAKKMKEKGVNIKLIQEITELTEEEINLL